MKIRRKGLEMRKRWGAWRRGCREWESALRNGVPVEAFCTIELGGD